MKTGLTYDDVLLIPQYSDIRSRSEVLLKSNLSDAIQLDLPIIASPMDTVSGREMANRISQLGAVAIVHRTKLIDYQDL